MSENLEVQKLSKKEVNEENYTLQGQTKPLALLSEVLAVGEFSRKRNNNLNNTLP